MERAEALALAGQKGWSEARAQGFVDGEGYRYRRERPPGLALFGIGDYGRGFRAGFLGVAVMDPESLSDHEPGVAGTSLLPRARRTGEL